MLTLLTQDFGGVAILLDNEKIVLGSNQRKCCLSIWLCWTRSYFPSRLIYPQAKILKWPLPRHQTQIKLRLPYLHAVHADNQSQSMKQKQDTHSNIFYGELGDIYKSESLKNLLPFMFDKNFL
jgi:cytidine deaminase